MAFRYGRGDPWVLRDVSISVPPGRIVEITGPNGAGKSTLLRLIAGILLPRRGRISGRPAVVGFAPERFPAAQPFTAAAYLQAMARMRGMSEAAGRAAVSAWADRLGFGQLLGVRLPELSKGSAHKVGLAQALLADPPLLLFDEPFAGLDPETRAALPPLLAELAYGGATVIVSDHQGALSRLPDIDRLRVDGHTVALAGGRTDHAVIEIVVPADEAEEAVRKLGADGYAVRGVRSDAGRERRLSG